MVALSLPVKPTLYHTRYYSSSRPLWLLMELGIIEKIDAEDTKEAPIALEIITYEQLKKDPVLTKLNPQRRLPFFIDPSKDNLSLNESGGLVQYLLETYDPEFKFHPAPGDKTRPEFLKLIHFGPATGYHIGVPLLFPDTIQEKAVDKKKREWHEIVAPTVEQALETYGGPYLLGDKFTAADVVVGYDVMTISFTKFSKELFEPHPEVESYHKKICVRPAYKTLFDHSDEDEKESEKEED